MRKSVLFFLLLAAQMAYSQKNILELKDCVVQAEKVDTTNIYSRFIGYFNDVVDAFGVNAEDYNVKLKFTGGKVATSHLNKATNERTININAQLINKKANGNFRLEKRLAYEVLAHEFTHHFFKDDPDVLDAVKEIRADFYSGSIIWRIENNLVAPVDTAFYSRCFLDNSSRTASRARNFRFGLNQRRIYETASNMDKVSVKDTVRALNELSANKVLEIVSVNETLKTYTDLTKIIKTVYDSTDFTKNKAFYFKNIESEIQKVNRQSDFTKKNDIGLIEKSLNEKNNNTLKIENEVKNMKRVFRNNPDAYANYNTQKTVADINKRTGEIAQIEKIKEQFYPTDYLNTQPPAIAGLCNSYFRVCPATSMDYDFAEVSCTIKNLTKNPSVSFQIDGLDLEYYRNIKLFQSTDALFPNYFKIREDKYLIDACGNLWLHNPSPSRTYPPKIFIQFQKRT